MMQSRGIGNLLDEEQTITR